jgi:hypothetical protein
MTRWLAGSFVGGWLLAWSALWGLAPGAFFAAMLLSFGAVGYVAIISAFAWFGSEGMPGPRALWIAAVLLLPGVLAWAALSGY